MPDTFYERKARQTGTVCVLEDTTREGAEFSLDGYRFVAVCRDHGTTFGVTADKWSKAYAATTDPRAWCAECAAMPAKTAPTPAAKPAKKSGTPQEEERAARERQRAAERMREARAAKAAQEEAQTRRDTVREARERMKAVPGELRAAARAYDKAFAAANRCRDAAQAEALWDAADKAQRTVIAVMRLRNKLKQTIERNTDTQRQDVAA